MAAIKKKIALAQQADSADGEPPTVETETPAVKDETPQQSLADQFGELPRSSDVLDVKSSEWTLDEDCFLIRHFGVRKTPPKQIEGKYVQLTSKNPDAYTKQGASLDLLRQRYDELTSPTNEFAHRYSILHHIENKLCALEDAAAAEASVKVDEEGQAPETLQQTSTEATGDAKRVEVRIVELSGTARNRLVENDEVMQESRLLSKMMDNLPPVYENVIPQLSIDANAFEFERGRQYEVVQVPIIERVLRFLESPDCVQKMIAHAEINADTEAALQEKVEKTKVDFNTRREFWARKARAKAEAEAAALKQQNEADFEHYTRHIRQFFDRRLQAALDQQQRKDKETFDKIEVFFARQEQRIGSMLTDLKDKDSAAALHEEQVKEAQQVVDYVFQPDFTMKLALASKLFECQALDEACRAIIRQQPMAYAGAKEWESELILEQYHREMLPTLRAEDIAELATKDPPACWFSRAHLEAEMKARRRIAEQELRQMTNDELQKQMREPSPWPDLLEAEVRERKQSRGSGALNVELAEGLPLKLDMDNARVEVMHPLRSLAVHGVVGVRSGSWGKPYFEVIIDKFDPAVGSTVCIGWDLLRQSLHPSPMPGLTAGEELRSESGNFGISLQNDGYVHLQGRTEAIPAGMIAGVFGDNSVVGCGLDLSTNCVSYFVDGKVLDLSSSYLNPSELRIKTPYTLVAAATMYAARNKSNCRLTFNFTGPFVHEQLVKQGFWEPLADLMRKG